MISSDNGASEGQPAPAPDHATDRGASRPGSGPGSGPSPAVGLRDGATDPDPNGASAPVPALASSHAHAHAPEPASTHPSTSSPVADTTEVGSAAYPRDAAERDAAPQFVLPLVVRVEKAAPPPRTDALETAARAVLTLLCDERATAVDGAWAEAVRDWQDARIRKVVRRARGAEWRRACELPGITVSGAHTEVRVFPPVPLDGWPKELAKLQVSGTELDDPQPPVTPGPEVPVLWLNPELEMSAGKAMAQAGHAAQLAWWELADAQREAWRRADFALAVRVAAPEHWAALTRSGLPVVRDAGFTEIAPGSCTVVADHPIFRGRPWEL
ncbi:peptidyl-tRNA hydrolase [Streptomyces zagrosensis]|uniref:peptidyl-tRNA hydrolase n=1 Tax=Streptomyces zagrosensis TaxID=1042984 RepID=A0A7W9UYL4_9ACTN|nr:peptidyl-tRNA hydrolase [Streptomyces zagrosensis]